VYPVGRTIRSITLECQFSLVVSVTRPQISFWAADEAFSLVYPFNWQSTDLNLVVDRQSTTNTSAVFSQSWSSQLFICWRSFVKHWYLLARRTAVEYVRSLENPMRVVWLAGTLGPHELDSLHSKWQVRGVVTAKRPQLSAVLHPFRSRKTKVSRVIVFFFKRCCPGF